MKEKQVILSEISLYQKNPKLAASSETNAQNNLIEILVNDNICKWHEVSYYHLDQPCGTVQETKRFLTDAQEKQKARTDH